jgi:hypothetical protein
MLEIRMKVLKIRRQSLPKSTKPGSSLLVAGLSRSQPWCLRIPTPTTINTSRAIVRWTTILIPILEKLLYPSQMGMFGDPDIAFGLRCRVTNATLQGCKVQCVCLELQPHPRRGETSSNDWQISQFLSPMLSECL